MSPDGYLDCSDSPGNEKGLKNNRNKEFNIVTIGKKGIQSKILIYIVIIGAINII
jgi:hypothetical protein